MKQYKMPGTQEVSQELQSLPYYKIEFAKSRDVTIFIEVSGDRGAYFKVLDQLRKQGFSRRLRGKFTKMWSEWKCLLIVQLTGVVR